MENAARRVMYHRDLWTFEWFEAPMDLDEFVWDFVGRTAGTHVDTFVLHLPYNLYPTKMTVETYSSEGGVPLGLQGDHATWASEGELSAGGWRMLKTRDMFVEQNIDPVTVLMDAAEQAGIDFFAGIRMNDVHHAQWAWHPRFWLEHPEFRLGDRPEYRYPRPGFRAPGGTFKTQEDDRIPAALDFTHDEVRAYKLAVIEDAVAAYDTVGVELDFTRHPFFFKPAEIDRGRAKMTSFVAAVRDRLNDIGERRGRPVVLSVRVPPTLDICWNVGLDVRAWLREGEVDILSMGPMWHPDFGMPVGEFLEAAKGTGCKVFASIEFAEMPVLRDAAATARVVRAAAMGYWQAGVDGIHLFNTHVFPHYFKQDMPFLMEVGSPRILQYLDKHYMVTRASNHDDAAIFSYPKQLPVTLKRSEPGKGARIRLRVGDDLERARRLGIAADVKLRLRVLNLTSSDRLEVRFNGASLDEASCRSAFFPNGEAGGLHQYSFFADAYFGVPGPYHWLELKLDGASLPRAGMNEVEVSLRERNPEVTVDPILNDVELTVRYGA